MLLNADQCMLNHKVNVWSALSASWTITIHSYVESHNLYLFSRALTSHLSPSCMYISKLSKLNSILMIWFCRLYDTLTFLLFRLCVISVIFHSFFFFFFSFIIFKHFHVKVKASASEKWIHQQGAQQPRPWNEPRWKAGAAFASPHPPPTFPLS